MLPYTTTANVVKICKQLTAESQPQPEPTPNYYPHLHYTIAELDQYANTGHTVPSEVMDDFSRATGNIIRTDYLNTSYVEIYTKDGYAFKGAICIVNDNGEGEGDLNCFTKDYIYSIHFVNAMDDETGDAHIEFTYLTKIENNLYQ